MLLSYQAGSVRVGEVVRYTLSYTPATDPIYPPPEELYVRVRNTSAIPLRAAYLHGPYTLYAACYPSTFDPNVAYSRKDTEGFPQFEPYLKAGGSWDATITIPQSIRQTPTELASADPGSHQSVTWVIEIVSQVIFSGTAAVNFEVIVGRDEKSVQLLSAGGVSGGGLPRPGQLHDHWSPKTRGQQVLAATGVYSNSITLRIDNTASLWNSPPFPSFEDDAKSKLQNSQAATETSNTQHQTTAQKEEPKKEKKKKIHLVVITHGLHSNLGADMLYLKESIDIAAKRAREQAKQDRQKKSNTNSDPTRPGSDFADDTDEDDEQVIVRGFFGNAVRTERGIQYLGKRLAKYVLLMTYPDQPYFPLKTSKAKPFPNPLAALKTAEEQSASGASVSGVHEQGSDQEDHAYQFTSISFIGHSLGGLIQTYAIAYIQKYSPQFFDHIRPINFIALATPFLGLSNENPVYVRFALDLGLVGRTGQDLGLSWTAPKVRSGWGAIIGGRGEAVKPQEHSDPGSKPLLRILPCGPAHEVLAKFQHRTVYSNVVNDGIVPLRTSSLLFLDWKGLDRVEKARRENGLVGTMAEWGWAELTGANSKSPRPTRPTLSTTHANATENTPSAALSQQQNEHGKVPTETLQASEPYQTLRQQESEQRHLESGDVRLDSTPKVDPSQNSFSPLNGLLSLFRPKDSPKTAAGHKQTKIYKRSQTLRTDDQPIETQSSTGSHRPEAPPHRMSHEEDGLYTPPKTTFFESASDLLMPPLPPVEFILDPASRPRTIFHDRIYHPDDIPAPLPVKRRTLPFSSPQTRSSNAQHQSSLESHHSSHQGKDESESGLRVEEKIARAYHRGLSWRKVLVRLEPDAHNNIIVRRMFTNAYGWPVVKHLVDTHFAYTSAAQSNDVFEGDMDRAKPPTIKTTHSGNEVQGQTDRPFQKSAPPGSSGSLYEVPNSSTINDPSQSLDYYHAHRQRTGAGPMSEYFDGTSSTSIAPRPDSATDDDDEDDPEFRDSIKPTRQRPGEI
ncbi:hypothetical protein SI65_07520 [Aspergillus cristatus]|uniref:DUF676 domain-containing protein n=1 Tax=Aspergillus cristatus TaxID=573508 RepID=A0A1E3B8J3_ASPCR|nr:hypothetical protein SI65_07520 [Aspergillus cristatus]